MRYPHDDLYHDRTWFDALGELLVHGVAVRPGHPVILGMIRREERSVPVIGVPGFPVSAALTGEIFVQPVLAVWLGKTAQAADTVEARLTRKVTSPAGDDALFCPSV